MSFSCAIEPSLDSEHDLWVFNIWRGKKHPRGKATNRNNICTYKQQRALSEKKIYQPVSTEITTGLLNCVGSRDVNMPTGKRQKSLKINCIDKVERNI
jgi:hypothetical protein